MPWRSHRLAEKAGVLPPLPPEADAGQRQRFFDQQLPEALLDAIDAMQTTSFGKERIEELAERFQVPLAVAVLAAVGVFAAIFTVLVLAVTEIIPKTLGVAFAGQLAKPVALGIRALTMILRPFVLASELISKTLRGGKTAPVTSMDRKRRPVYELILQP